MCARLTVNMATFKVKTVGNKWHSGGRFYHIMTAISRFNSLIYNNDLHERHNLNSRFPVSLKTELSIAHTVCNSRTRPVTRPDVSGYPSLRVNSSHLTHKDTLGSLSAECKCFALKPEYRVT